MTGTVLDGKYQYASILFILPKSRVREVTSLKTQCIMISLKFDLLKILKSTTWWLDWTNMKCFLYKLGNLQLSIRFGVVGVYCTVGDKSAVYTFLSPAGKFV